MFDVVLWTKITSPYCTVLLAFVPWDCFYFPSLLFFCSVILKNKTLIWNFTELSGSGMGLWFFRSQFLFQYLSYYAYSFFFSSDSNVYCTDRLIVTLLLYWCDNAPLICSSQLSLFSPVL